MDLNALLRNAVDAGATDCISRSRCLRSSARMARSCPLEGFPALAEEDLEAFLVTITATNASKLDAFRETGELDTAYMSTDLTRFRVNGFRQRGAISFAFRVIPKVVPSFGDLRLPAGVQKLAEEHRGLILVTGATGSGKTTTLAAMIDHINSTRRQHIVTIEDPIEILHPDRACIVNQREVGLDTAVVRAGPRRALRQDPDVILIGELRDTETAETALQAAESGHLVFSTLHTIDAAETLARMIEFFPAEAAADPLDPRRRAPRRRQPAPAAARRRRPRRRVEVMVTNARIADLIRENRAEEISDAIAAGEYFDMQTLRPAADRPRPRRRRSTEEVAANSATNRHDFLVALESAAKRQRAATAQVEAEVAAEEEARENGIVQLEQEPGDEEPLQLRVVPPAESR